MGKGSSLDVLNMAEQMRGDCREMYSVFQTGRTEEMQRCSRKELVTETWVHVYNNVNYMDNITLQLLIFNAMDTNKNASNKIATGIIYWNCFWV